VTIRMPSHDLSLAHPKRLCLDRDEEGIPFHVLGGERIDPGTLLLLQLADGTWLTGSYHWDVPSADRAAPWASPRFRVHLADPFTTADRPRLAVEFHLPADAVLRVHPSWKRAMNPRPPRNPRARRKTP